ncbi:MAG: hypothetical protein IPN95_19045 [Bacteroidetes bacterium]|nr:hypothetical protein [Bacteroidota bacterium]
MKTSKTIGYGILLLLQLTFTALIGLEIFSNARMDIGPKGVFDNLSIDRPGKDFWIS